MEYKCNVYIIDEIMGRGKSFAAINFMNSHNDQKFLYITPYIDEIKNRIIPMCAGKNFVTPDNSRYGTKTRHLKLLMNQGKNIASTHALFKLFDEELIDICRNQNYTLIMDEVSDVVEQHSISKDDVNTLLEKYVNVDEETSLLRWREDQLDYRGKFEKEKRLCDMGCLGKYGSDIMVWLFPIQAFNAFKNVYILTYMFNAQIQRYYYDYYGLSYNYLHVIGDSVENYRFSKTESSTKYTVDYTGLIHICENAKLNDIGAREFDLSKSWYMRNCASNNSVIKKLRNNLFNYFHNIASCKAGDTLWTTFSDYKRYISGKGYARGYIPSNSRATNEYRDRFVAAYPINKFIHAAVKGFFVKKNVSVDEDGYALSEMLQWIWRSAIRDGKEIWIYIPSSRMRNLLKDWIEKVSNSY
mgnify:CR=1 FL=1